MNQDPERHNYPAYPAGQDFRREPPAPPLEAQPAPVRVPAVSPLVTYSLLVTTVLVFFAQLASVSTLGTDLPAALGMKINEQIALGEFWRLITPMFLHSSGSILHIGFNMYALHIFGPSLERHFGHLRFLALYFVAGFAGNVASMIFSPHPSLGSSTAIFGLLGAQGVFLYHNREVLGGFGRRALNSILMIALINLFIGLSPGIDNWGHMGGLLGGTLFAWFGGPILALEGIFPNLSVQDRRETREVFLTGLMVAAIFALLAAATIYLRGG